MADSNPNPNPATPPADAAAPPPPPAAPDGKVWVPDRSEWVEQQKTVRAALDGIRSLSAQMASFKPATAPAATSTPAAGSAPVPPPPAAAAEAKPEEWAAELSFRDALDDLDAPMTKAQKAVLRRLYRAEHPTDIGTWLNETARSMGISAGAPAPQTSAAAATPPPASPTAPQTNATPAPKPESKTVNPVTNTGAPGAQPVGQANLPVDPHTLSPSQIREMGREEFGRRLKDWKDRFDPQRNPWAHLRPTSAADHSKK